MTQYKVEFVFADGKVFGPHIEESAGPIKAIVDAFGLNADLRAYLESHPQMELTIAVEPA